MPIHRARLLYIVTNVSAAVVLLFAQGYAERFLAGVMLLLSCWPLWTLIRRAIAAAILRASSAQLLALPAADPHTQAADPGPADPPADRRSG